MQIRCQHCQKPFALTKEALLNALEELEQQKLHHYNAICPHCGRTNRVSQKELKRAVPRIKATQLEVPGSGDLDQKN
ncbi:MAG: CpXC domain-containing protein [Anaerolineales bacterium]|nr:CpXC domain-containing protein [Anaerolineales bacterium]